MKKKKIVKVITLIELGEYQFQCPKCKKIHNQSAYCVAQKAMGHDMFFTCDCGKKIEV